MDSLSRLLALYPMRTALDVRCHFGAPFVLQQDAAGAGIAPYHLILQGQARLTVAGQPELALQAGDIVLFPHGGAHTLHLHDAALAPAPVHEVASASPLRTVVNDGAGAVTDILCGQFTWEPQVSQALLATLPPCLLVRTQGAAHLAGLQSLLTLLQQEAEQAQPGAATVLAQLSSALFAMLMRAWLAQKDQPPGLFAALAERRLQAALQAMLARPGESWNLDRLAEVCHMSRANFARVFRQVAGTTPAALLQQLRMAQAAQWLRQDSRPVAAIGEQAGYQSEAAFNRVFKRAFGVGPGQYRRTALAPSGATAGAPPAPAA